MPKKTKREKQEAQERRLRQLQQPFSPHHVSTPNAAVPEIKKALPQATETVNKTHIVKDTHQKSYFTHDLRRSLIGIVMIFTLEILIYFATINNYFHL